MKTKILLILTVLFFAAMAALTITARSIHESMIPNVTAKRLSREIFGDSYVRKLAAPKALTESGEVFVITVRVVNGEKRNFAQKVQLAFGAENEAFYEITGGMMGNELVIFESDRDIHDGDEVFVVKDSAPK